MCAVRREAGLLAWIASPGGVLPFVAKSTIISLGVWLENLNLRGGFKKTIVDYFYHEEVRGTANSGVRNKK